MTADTCAAPPWIVGALARLVNDPKRASTRDKVVFTFSLTLLVVNGLWLGRAPHSYPLTHVVQSLVLLSLRWVTYR